MGIKKEQVLRLITYPRPCRQRKHTESEIVYPRFGDVIPATPVRNAQAAHDQQAHHPQLFEILLPLARSSLVVSERLFLFRIPPRLIEYSTRRFISQTPAEYKYNLKR